MDNKLGFGGKKRDLKKNHKRSTGDVSAFILVKRQDQGAKRRDVRQDLGKERGRR